MVWRRHATASSSSAKTASPTCCVATLVSTRACCASRCSPRRATSPRPRSPMTWPSWPSAAHERALHMTDQFERAAARALAGNLERGREKLARQNKLFVRERLDLLLDAGSLSEDGLLANALAEDLPADGVVTGVGTVEGRAVCVMA